MKWSMILLASLVAGSAFAADVLPDTALTTRVQLKNADGSNAGVVLASSFGQTLYTFDPDSSAPGSSACSGKCAETWPPITVSAEEVAAVNDSEFGTAARPSGLLQLTYDGKPVYTFNKDRAAGDTKGDGLGGVWHIIND